MDASEYGFVCVGLGSNREMGKNMYTLLISAVQNRVQVFTTDRLTNSMVLFRQTSSSQLFSIQILVDLKVILTSY